MNKQTGNRAHWSFWTIGALALFWNIMGIINFFMQRDLDVLAQYTDVARSIVENRPAWATGAFAIAIFGGALGCILLLLRKSIAYYVFIGSLLAMLAQMVPVLNPGGNAMDLGLFEISTYVLMPLVVAAFLIGYSKHAEKKGWIH